MKHYHAWFASSPDAAERDARCFRSYPTAYRYMSDDTRTSFEVRQCSLPACATGIAKTTTDYATGMVTIERLNGEILTVGG